MGSCCSKSNVTPIDTSTTAVSTATGENDVQITREATGTLSILSVKSEDSQIFPDIKDIPVLTHAPIINSSLLPPIEETFWEEKRKLIPDYRVMLEIDTHVLKANDSLKKDPAKLVQYLIQLCKDDIQKARAITRWMGEHVQYDIEFLKTGIRGDQSPQAVILSGKAVCEGYSNTFTYLGQLAGLECRGISGQAKGAGYYPGCFNPDKLSEGPGPHAWSAVKLYGRWFLCDATWAAGATCNGEFKKKWQEEYFLSEPASFLLEHIPLDGNMIKPEDQHIAQPITDARAWVENPLTSPQANMYGIRPLTHARNIIHHTSGDELVIEYQCQHPMRHCVDVKKISKKGNTRIATTVPNFDRMVAMFKTGTLIVLRCRFQEQGVYEVKISANKLTKENLNDKKFSVQTILSYHVEVANKCNKPIFPKGLSDNWGIQEGFTLSGYAVISPRECVAKTKNGVAVVKAQLPTHGVLPNMFKLLANDQDLSEYCIAGRRGNKAYYIVQCPQKGEYRLDIYVKKSADDTGFFVEASVLIQCDSPARNPVKAQINNSFLGVTDEFLKAGLTTSVKDSILQAKDGQARMRIRKSNKDTSILADLTCDGNSAENTVKQETDGDVITLTITTPERNFYVLNLFAAPEGTKSCPFVARFGVNNSKLLK